jgi:hypothetical protein
MTFLHNSVVTLSPTSQTRQRLPNRQLFNTVRALPAAEIAQLDEERFMKRKEMMRVMILVCIYPSKIINKRIKGSKRNSQKDM